MPQFPAWLDTLCSAALILGVLCSLTLLIDVLRRPQHMAIMNFVWPICALFGIVFITWLYFRYGRNPQKESTDPTAHSDKPAAAPPPFAVGVVMGTLHCGAGCALGDIVAEWLAFLTPGVAIKFGWHSLFDERVYAIWTLDFVAAFAFGIVFQYFAIAPMRDLSLGQGFIAALKADSLSLIAWQIGMYCLMAGLQFVVFKHAFGHPAPVDSVEFWAAMQVAMIGGFLTSYPMNWWLIRTGVKERMLAEHFHTSRESAKAAHASLVAKSGESRPNWALAIGTAVTGDDARIVSSVLGTAMLREPLTSDRCPWDTPAMRAAAS